MVSFAHPEQMPLLMDICQSVAADNGAYSMWRAGNAVKDWTPFYAWIQEWYQHPAFDWCLIPDVIDGSEWDNDELVRQFPFQKHIGVPVWHLHEGLDRIWRLRDAGFTRIALGSSGEFAAIRTDRWNRRMAEAMVWLCDKRGRPHVKIHGLRMMDTKVFSQFPFASADSTNVARNVGLDSRWRGTYTPPNKATRGIVLANRIEAHQSASEWTPYMMQQELTI